MEDGASISIFRWEALRLWLFSSFLTLPSSNEGDKISFREQLRQMDLPGSFCLVFVCFLHVLALHWGGTTYP